MIIKLILLIVIFALAVYFMQLIKSFGYMNTNELRRRAEAGNLRAEKVLLARSHGLRLWFILWTILICLMVSFILLLHDFINHTLLSIFVSVAATVGLLFALPWAQWPAPNLKLAASSSLVLNFILTKLNIVFWIFKPFKLNQKINSEAPIYIHSKENLLDIVEELKDKATTKEVRTDLNLATAALIFSTQNVGTIMTKIKDVTILSLDQKINPVLIDELHSLKCGYFPVRHPKTRHFTGILYFQDIETIRQESIAINKVMKPDPCYINIKSPIKQVIYAFLKTNHYLFLVTDNTKEVKGVISVHDVLKLYLKGSDSNKNDSSDEFENYDNLEEVAQIFDKLDSTK